MKNETLLIILFLSSSSHAASLTVVEETSERSSSATIYYESLNPSPDTSEVRHLPAIPLKVDEFSMLPVKSMKITPGKETARTLNASGLAQPVFLVGNDPLSLSWLAQRRQALAAINAVGFAVSVPDATALRSIRNTAPELHIMPISGDDIAVPLNIRHYPVLITSTSIEQ